MSREEDFLSRDIFFAGRKEGIELLAGHLNVDPSMILHDGYDDDYERYRLRRNALRVVDTKGDFSSAITFDLFDCTQEKLEECLLDVSRENLVFALPDEEDGRPWMYILFNQGKRLSVEIHEDEILDEIRLVQPEKKEAGS